LSTSSSPFPAEAAVTAFLHGIERRAWVFARAQCGDEALAGQAVALAVREFRLDCAGKPLASWPRDFWSLLLAQPLLLQGKSQLLPQLSVGPRAALLLRLVAGLDVLHAAQVLGVSEAAYRAALSHALQQMHAAGDDPPNLEALREHLQLEIRQAPTLLRMLPEQAVETEGSDSGDLASADVVAAENAQNVPRWPWQLPAKILLAALLLALVVSFFWTPWHGLAPGESEPLPAEIVALAPADASATVTHPDFALLATPADETLAQDLAFYSWLAAGGQADAAAENPPASAGSIERAGLPASSATTSKVGP
jgi:DNA-directed RNA polymerase specialized sigma24 family protein